MIRFLTIFVLTLAVSFANDYQNLDESQILELEALKLKMDKTQLNFQNKRQKQEQNLSKIVENYYSISLQNLYSDYRFNLVSQNSYLFFESRFKTKGLLLKMGFGKVQDNRFELGLVFASNDKLTQQALIKNLYGVQINTINPFNTFYNAKYANNLLPFVATEFRYAHLYFNDKIKKRIEKKDYIYALSIGVSAGLQVQILTNFVFAASYGVNYIDAQNFLAFGRNCQDGTCSEQFLEINPSGTNGDLRFEFSYFF